MKDRVGEKQKGYRRHEVLCDGDCGFTAFGISRKDAFKLLADNITNEQLLGLVKPAIASVLITEGFYTYIKRAGAISEDISFDINGTTLRHSVS